MLITLEATMLGQQGSTHTHTQTDYCNPAAHRVKNNYKKLKRKYGLSTKKHTNKGSKDGTVFSLNYRTAKNNSKRACPEVFRA